jgi:hypothetical protein
MRWWLLALTMGCAGADSDLGLAGWLRVEAAQYERDPMPAAGSGPEIVALRVPHEQALPGRRRELVKRRRPKERQNL